MIIAHILPLRAIKFAALTSSTTSSADAPDSRASMTFAACDVKPEASSSQKTASARQGSLGRHPPPPCRWRDRRSHWSRSRSRSRSRSQSRLWSRSRSRSSRHQDTKALTSVVIVVVPAVVDNDSRFGRHSCAGGPSSSSFYACSTGLPPP